MKNQLGLFDENNENKKNKKDDFLKELQEMDCTPKEQPNVEPDNWQDKVLEITDDSSETLVNKLAEEEEMKKLEEELEKDKQEGLLYEEEAFYILDEKLIVTRYQKQIHNNLKNLAKSIIDFKWKQNINPETIIVNFKENDKGDYVYDSVICTNQFGVRFRVVLRDILEKLSKIPFE
jgi:hypothetical protein